MTHDALRRHRGRDPLALSVGPDGAVVGAALSASGASDEGDDDEQARAGSPLAPLGGKAVLYRIVPDSATVA